MRIAKLNLIICQVIRELLFKTDEKGKLQHLYLDAQEYFQDLRETIIETLIAIAQNETTDTSN